MNLFCKTRSRALHERATATEFCHLFASGMESLYLLSLILTANPELAEECLISSFDDCLNGVSVAAEWAHSWAKRAVIKNAIRLIGPGLYSTTVKARENGALRDYRLHPMIGNILGLRNFERLVFVMCVLERYPKRDSAALLGCRSKEINEARARALQQLAAF